MGMISMSNLTIDNSSSDKCPINKKRFTMLANVSSPMNWILSNTECLKFLVTSSIEKMVMKTNEKYK
jgi:hypothetical protein